MSRLDAERLARLYEGFYAEHDSKEALPRFLNSPPIKDRDPSHTSALETIAGFAVLALVAIIFGVIL
jgi:hypothetical protein